MEIFPFQYVVFNDVPKAFALLLADFCVTVSGKVNEIPVIIDYKVIDRLRLSGFVGSFFAKFFRLVSIFNREDLPTLDRPMKANSGLPAGGHFCTSATLETNSACLISMLDLK